MYPVPRLPAPAPVRYTRGMARHRTPPRLAALLLVPAVACGELPPPSQCQTEGSYDLNFTGSGFGGLEDPLVSYRLTNAGETFVVESGAAIVEDGGWNEVLSCALEGGSEYSFHWYFDDDQDGHCGASDRSFLVDIGSPDRDVTVEAEDGHNDNDQACAPF